MNSARRWMTVATYAVAMAWVESAVVFYLRTMVDRIEPYQPNPLPIATSLGSVELIREAATLLMLFTVGILAGKTWRSRWGYAAIAFGIWDIFYYVFLKVMSGWPHGLEDWDVLFLLPLPWWGPVISPVLIALLMIGWGTLVTQGEAYLRHPLCVEWRMWLVSFAGMALALGVFMEDELRVAGGGIGTLRSVLPVRFDWPWFLIALALMATPLFQGWRQIRAARFADRQNHLNTLTDFEIKTTTGEL